jgi:hypothetical protein
MSTGTPSPVVRVAAWHRPRKSPRGRSGCRTRTRRSGAIEDLAQLLDVLLEVADEEARQDAVDGHLAQPRMEAAAGEVARGEGPHPGCKPACPRGEVVEQLRGWLEAVAPDPLDPGRIGRDAPERNGLLPAVEDPGDLGLPVVEHLRDVGEDLLRAPVRFGLAAVGSAERPRVAGRDVGPEALDRGAGGTETDGEGGHVGRFGWFRHRLSFAPRA